MLISWSTRSPERFTFAGAPDPIALRAHLVGYSLSGSIATVLASMLVPRSVNYINHPSHVLSICSTLNVSHLQEHLTASPFARISLTGHSLGGSISTCTHAIGACTHALAPLKSERTNHTVPTICSTLNVSHLQEHLTAPPFARMSLTGHSLGSSIATVLAFVHRDNVTGKHHTAQV